MPKGPFASSVGVGRAEPEWAALNQVGDCVGSDPIHAAGEAAEGPLRLDDAITSGDLSSAPAKVDLLIVGAGLSGAVIAERCSRELGMTSLIIDVRDHIGGNCYDYIDPHGIRASRYGAHLFHTQFERVWEYVQQFSEWLPFDHRVKGRVPDLEDVKRLVPIPPTQETVNTLFGEKIGSAAEMEAWYAKQRVAPPSGEPQNGEEAALSRVGPLLYERIFKHYTKKQWDKYPEELDASVLLRLPCRTTTDDRYFGDQWQALPRRGYTRIFENMLLNDPRIAIRLGVDFFKARDAGKLPEYGMLVYTGPIDSYFAAQGLPKLEYRSLRFEETWVEEPDDGFYQARARPAPPSPRIGRHVPARRRAASGRRLRICVRTGRRRWWSTTRAPMCPSRVSSSTSTYRTSPTPSSAARCAPPHARPRAPRAGAARASPSHAERERGSGARHAARARVLER